MGSLGPSGSLGPNVAPTELSSWWCFAPSLPLPLLLALGLLDSVLNLDIYSTEPVSSDCIPIPITLTQAPRSHHPGGLCATPVNLTSILFLCSLCLFILALMPGHQLSVSRWDVCLLSDQVSRTSLWAPFSCAPWETYAIRTEEILINILVIITYSRITNSWNSFLGEIQNNRVHPPPPPHGFYVWNDGSWRVLAFLTSAPLPQFPTSPVPAVHPDNELRLPLVWGLVKE